MRLLGSHDAHPEHVCAHAADPADPDGSIILYAFVADVERRRLWVCEGPPCRRKPSDRPALARAHDAAASGPSRRRAMCSARSHAGFGAVRVSGSRLVAVRMRNRLRIARERATRSATPGARSIAALAIQASDGVPPERVVEPAGIGREVGCPALEDVADAGRRDVRARERLVHAVARERIDEPGRVADGQRRGRARPACRRRASAAGGRAAR